MKTAVAAIKSFDVMRMIRRGYYILTKPRATGEIRPVNKLFGLTG
jgi:transposase, IS6 family